MEAGSLRHRVSIQTESETLDSYGEPTSGWSTDSTVWASVVPTSGRETNEGEGLSGVVTFKVTMRYNTAVSPKKRLLFGSRVLGITKVINKEERNEYLELHCEERVN